MKKKKLFISTGLKIAVFYFDYENHDDVYVSSGLGKD